MSSLKETGWVPIARLLRPQGRRGEILAEPLSDLPDIFAAGTTITLSREGTSTPSSGSECRIEEHWFPTGKNAGRVVLKLAGCDSISAAEALSGREVLLSSSALPNLEEDTFFVGDLLGCEFFNGETRAGIIVDVQFATGPDGRTRLEDAAPLLGVALSPDTDPVLVPFVKAWLETVDLSKRRVVMRVPEGLLVADEAYVDQDHNDDKNHKNDDDEHEQADEGEHKQADEGEHKQADEGEHEHQQDV